MAWTILITAGLFEVAFTTFLKLSNNFSNIKYSIIFAVCAIVSFLLLNKAIQTIPVGTAYAVWTGIGASGAAVVGMIHFGEGTEFWRVFFIVLLIISIVGLKFFARG